MPDPENTALLRCAVDLFRKFKQFPQALRFAMQLNDMKLIEDIFLSCKDLWVCVCVCVSVTNIPVLWNDWCWGAHMGFHAVLEAWNFICIMCPDSFFFLYPGLVLFEKLHYYCIVGSIKHIIFGWMLRYSFTACIVG